MLSYSYSAMVATVGFLRGEPQDCNQSLCQKRAPWAPLQLIQPNNKQQITALACRQQRSPHGRGARKRGALSSRVPTWARRFGSIAALSFSYSKIERGCCRQVNVWVSWENDPHCPSFISVYWLLSGICKYPHRSRLHTSHCVHPANVFFTSLISYWNPVFIKVGGAQCYSNPDKVS